MFLLAPRPIAITLFLSKYRWIKHKIRHMAVTGDGQSLFRRTRSPNVCANTFLRPGLFRVNWTCRIPAPRWEAIFPPMSTAFTKRPE
jgi:hypothetical protein